VTRRGVQSPCMAEKADHIEAALRLSAIVDSSDDAIVSKDLNGTVMTWNRAAERMFGYTAAEMIGRPILIIIPADRIGEEEYVLDCVSRGVGVDHYETERRHKDGQRVLVSLTVSPIRAADGTLLGASKIARDIGERKRLMAELERANRVKDEFLATLSHELRTPLNAILGYSRLLRGEMMDEAGRTRAIETIERNATALAQLVSDVLDVSRIISGKMRFDVERCDIASIVTSATDSIVPAVLAKRIELRQQLDRDTGLVAGDPNRLQQVFWNVLSNAVKFTPEGGRIDVITARVGTAARISVRDTGRGIDANLLPHVFERFHQGDSSTTRSVGGLGLGLAIVRHYVELHGGRVRAESDGLGTGATFTIELPLAR
jgi:PAS domain S-box-containing protein